MWTTKRVAELIRRHFGVSLHHDHVGRFLHKVLKWSPQKPRKKARERDEKAIRRWRRNELPRIVEEASARHAHLVFLDESGFMLTPTVRRTWGPTGRTPELSTPDRRDRLSTISAITLSPERSRLNFYFTTLATNKNVKAPNVVDFLRHLKRQLGGPFTVLWTYRKHAQPSAARQGIPGEASGDRGRDVSRLYAGDQSGREPLFERTSSRSPGQSGRRRHA